MDPNDRLGAADAMRRRILGDAYVDAANPTEPTMREFADFVTETAWGVWAREGALSTRDRSLLVVAMTAAVGRTDELRIHLTAAPNAGVTDEEVDELLYQVTAYCGAPAGVTMRRTVEAVRAERAERSES